MAAAIVNICVDPRLGNDSIRAQIQSRLQAMDLKADRIFITNEPGGNVGSSMRSTLEMLAAQHEPIVFLAVLHHTDCAADAAGRRRPLDLSLRDLNSLATGAGVSGPVLAGNITTDTMAIDWTTESHRPTRTYSLLPKPKQTPTKPRPALQPPKRRAP